MIAPLLRLALRNLGRHRRRTAITAAALAAGVALFIFMDSMLRGMDSESQRNLVWYETGAGRIVGRAQHAELERPALQHEIVEYRPLLAGLDRPGPASVPCMEQGVVG